jgi:hypothetical protein
MAWSVEHGVRSRRGRIRGMDKAGKREKSKG